MLKNYNKITKEQAQDTINAINVLADNLTHGDWNNISDNMYKISLKMNQIINTSNS